MDRAGKKTPEERGGRLSRELHGGALGGGDRRAGAGARASGGDQQPGDRLALPAARRDQRQGARLRGLAAGALSPNQGQTPFFSASLAKNRGLSLAKNRGLSLSVVELRRRGEGARRVDHEHDERVERLGAAAPDLHGLDR